MKADWLTAVTAPDASVISTTKFFEEANASFSAVASSAPAANVTFSNSAPSRYTMHSFFEESPSFSLIVAVNFAPLGYFVESFALPVAQAREALPTVPPFPTRTAISLTAPP